MAQFIIVYAKITDDKKNGVQFSGPFVGPVRDSQDEADEAARGLINGSRNVSIIPKIYEMGNKSYIDILEESQPYFNRLKDNILTAKEILNNPIKKKKRKRLKRLKMFEDEK